LLARVLDALLAALGLVTFLLAISCSFFVGIILSI
jgi:hypothetical protein